MMSAAIQNSVDGHMTKLNVLIGAQRETSGPLDQYINYYIMHAHWTNRLISGHYNYQTNSESLLVKDKIT